MYTVIRDTREKPDQGWWFRKSNKCDGTIEKKLDTGDYSIVGLTDILTIERKGSVSEFARNVVQERFIKELNRLSEFEFSFILLEFDMDNVIKYPKGCGMSTASQKRCRVKGSYFLRRIIELEMQYPTKIIFVGSHGRQVADSIFRRTIETIGPKRYQSLVEAAI